MSDDQTIAGFKPLDTKIRSYYLDTNVWSSLASSSRAMERFLLWLEENNAIAALSLFTIFELSRASVKHVDIDRLIGSAVPRIYIPLMYDELSDLEINNYPHDIELLWNPVSSFNKSEREMFLSTISKDPRFLIKRQEYIDFGFEKFMRLDTLKKNFPLDKGGKFSKENAELFAWATSLDFLIRHFPNVLLPFKGNLQSFNTPKLKSLYIRSLFLYFKYYVHEQNPLKSDFMDFAHVSYLPYVDVFVTERNVLNVLSRIKILRPNLVNSDLIHVGTFLREIENFIK